MKKIKNLWIILNKRGIVSLFNSIINFVQYLFYKFILSSKYLKKKIYNFKMYLNLHDKGISKTLILFGERELDHKIILEKVLKKNMSIMDIGSNIGYYVLLQRNIIGSDAKIIAIEPIPQNIEFLKKNLELNNDLKTKVIQAINCYKIRNILTTAALTKFQKNCPRNMSDKNQSEKLMKNFNI